MKRILYALFFVLAANGALVASVASAHEFHLQFAVASSARGLSVIGYEFVEDPVSGTIFVVGNCSYYTYSACSGRGCRPVRTNHYNTCAWDLYGNLSSVTPGAPPAQSSLYTNGTKIVYAVSDGCAAAAGEGPSCITTGQDSAGFGFVETPASHYSWE